MARVAPVLTGKAALRVFCTPVSGKPGPKDLEFLATARQELQAVGRHQLMTYFWGKPGQHAVLLVHGWQSHSARWRHYVPAFLEQGWSVYAVDGPAHGQSSGTQMSVYLFSKLLSRLLPRMEGIQAMVGHSLGAGTIITAGSWHPELQPPRMVAMAGYNTLGRLADDWCHVLGANERVKQQLLAAVEPRFGHPSHYFNLENHVPALNRTQGLLIHDLDDDVSPASESQELAALWPAAQTLITKGLGHRLIHPQVTKAVVQFVTRGEMPSTWEE